MIIFLHLWSNLLAYFSIERYFKVIHLLKSFKVTNIVNKISLNYSLWHTRTLACFKLFRSRKVAQQDNNRLCYNDPLRPFLRDLSKFPISIRAGNLNAWKGWRKDSEKNNWGEKIAARKLEGELLLSRSTDYRIMTSPLSDLSFIAWEQFKSRACYAS